MPSQDLLSPTLTADDDVSGFNKPWNPLYIVFISFFFGLICGGALFSFNFKRLGWEKYFYVTLMIVISLVILMYSTIAFCHTQDVFDLQDKEQKRLVRIVQKAFILVVALIIFRKQKRRYRLSYMSEVSPGSLWIPAIVAIIVGVFLEVNLAIYINYFLG